MKDLRALLALVAGEPHPLEAVEDVGAHALPGKQREVLEHDAAVGARRADRLALDQDLAGLGRQEAADQIEQRRLAAAGRAEQREEFPASHIQRHILERQHRPPARRPVDVVDALDDDLRLRHFPAAPPLPALSMLGTLERDDFIFELSSRSSFLLEHDLFRKPVSTFRDHALPKRRRNATCPRQRTGVSSGFPAKCALILSIISWPMAVRVSIVALPWCGCTMTLGNLSTSGDGLGSLSNTSSAA